MKRIFLLFSFLSVLCLSSCGRNRGNVTEFYEESSGVKGVPRLAMAKMAVANDSAVLESAGESVNSSVNSGFERKLIYNGDITIEVSDLLKLQDGIEKWSKAFGGYVSNSNVSQKTANFTVRIPSEKFDAAMEEAGNFGLVKSKGVSTNDVSEEYYDLQSRLETRKLLREKLKSYLKQASNMQDMLKVERELNSVQSEIESMEGRMKRLTSQIDFATITIYASLPYSTTPSGGIEFPDLGDGFRHFVAGLVGFFGGFITVILYGVICGVPVLAVIALFYWILFGKIGLLINLFNKLKK